MLLRRMRDRDLDAAGARQALGEAFREILRTMMSTVAAGYGLAVS